MQSPTSKAAADSMPREADTGRRLGMALLGYMLAATLIVTLLPFQFAWPQTWYIRVGTYPLDFVLNVVLFVPLGFLYRMVTPRVRGSMALIVLNAALLSFAIEGMQLFDAAREATVLDVVANALGAAVGVLAWDRVARSAQLSGRVIGWLGLEMPLMGLVYLLVPLLWVNSIGARSEPAPLVATMLIGVFGALLLGGLQRHYFGPARTAEAHRTALFAAIWFMAGAFALVPWRPQALAAGTAAVAALCWWQGRRGGVATGSNRRFEGALLRAALPVFGAYLLVLIASPVLTDTRAWHVHIGFPYLVLTRVEIARLLELIGAFTLVGYMAAEIRGREPGGYRDAVPRLIVWGVALAIALEAVRGFSVYGASLARGALLAAACLYGGWLYFLQRAHVIRVVSGREPHGNQG